MTMVVHGTGVNFSHSDMGTYGIDVQSDGGLTMEDIDTAEVGVAGTLLADHIRLTTELTITGSGEADVSNLLGRRLVVETGASGIVRLDGARLLGQGSSADPIVDVEGASLQEFQATGLLLGRKGSATFLNHLHIKDLIGGVIEAESWRATQTAVILDTCQGVDLDVKVKGSGSAADNTHPAISLIDSDQIDLRGSVRGGAPYAPGGQNPSYGVAVDADCTDIDIWMSITGAETGAIDDATTGEVTVH